MLEKVNFNPLTLSWRKFVSYRHHSIDLQSKLMDYFLYDRDLRRERVKRQPHRMVKHGQTISRQQSTNFLSVFDYIVRLALKELSNTGYSVSSPIIKKYILKSVLGNVFDQYQWLDFCCCWVILCKKTFWKKECSRNKFQLF